MVENRPTDSAVVKHILVVAAVSVVTVKTIPGTENILETRLCCESNGIGGARLLEHKPQLTQRRHLACLGNWLSRTGCTGNGRGYTLRYEHEPWSRKYI
jgi:hypothetical protein